MLSATKVKPYACLASAPTLSDNSENSENESDSKNVIDYFQTDKNIEKVPVWRSSFKDEFFSEAESNAMYDYA